MKHLLPFVSSPARAMRFFQFLAASLLSLPVTASAELVLYEAFGYTPGQALQASPPWTAGNFVGAGGPRDLVVEVGSLSVPAPLGATFGNRVQLAQPNSNSERGSASRFFPEVTLVNDGDEFWVSFVIRAGIPIQHYQEPVLYIGTPEANSQVRLTTGIPVGRPNDMRLTIKRGSESGNPTNTGYVPINVDHFVVLRYQRATATDQTLRIWLNPNQAEFGEGVAPTSTSVVNSIGGFVETFNWMQLYTFQFVDSCLLDELRIGRTWASVSSPAPIPAFPELALEIDEQTLAPSSFVDFGTVSFGATSPSETFTIRNNGSADLNITGIGILSEGVTSTQFLLDDSAILSPVPPGGSTTFSVSFAPVQFDEPSGLLTLQSNDPDNPVFTVYLTGTALMPPPAVGIDAATDITTTGATLNGTVNPGGLATSAFFEYGPTPGYGSTANVSVSPDDGTATQSVSAVIAGLTPNTVYHYRLTATSAAGSVDSTGGAFTTSPAGLPFAWGNNTDGRLGDGTLLSKTTPVEVATDDLGNVVAVSAGHEFSLAMKADGTVWAWGRNTNGQLGDGTIFQRTTPVKIGGLGGVVAIAAGAYHSLALKADGTVWAWGSNGAGQIGDGTTSSQRNAPVQVAGIGGVTAIAAGSYHSLAVKSDGSVWAWGNNGSGQLGDGSTTNRNTPVQVADLTGAVAVAGGSYHSLAVKTDGTVWAWGYNVFGQLGNNTLVDSGTPVQVAGIDDAVSVAAGGFFSLAMTSGGTIRSWGQNSGGQLGDGTFIQSTTPVQVVGIPNAKAVVAGSNHSLALTTDGSIRGWGGNGPGAIGDGTSGNNRSTPVQVSGLSGAIAVAAGSSHSLTSVIEINEPPTDILLSGTSIQESQPIGTVVGILSAVDPDEGDTHTFSFVEGEGDDHNDSFTIDGNVLKTKAIFDFATLNSYSIRVRVTDGGLSGFENQFTITVTPGLAGPVFAWGDGTYGRTDVPPDLDGVSKVAAGFYHSLALKSNGTVVAWGRNNFGQTTLPPGLSNVTAIAAGRQHSLALKSDGTVEAWGANGDGQADVPPGLSGVIAIAAGEDHNVVLKNDGTVVAWGASWDGEGEVPPGLANVMAISAGNNFNLALKSDGTVVAWGANWNGQTNIPAGLERVTAIAAGSYHALALKSDGTVVVWGSGFFGNLDIPAGLSGVTAIAAGLHYNFALRSDGTVLAWGNNQDGQTDLPVGLSQVKAISANRHHALAVGEIATLSPYDLWILNFPALTGDDALPGSDPDGDGVTNEQEFLDGTDPTNPDSFLPSIYAQPQSVAVPGGGTGGRAVFEVGANAGATASYQWYLGEESGNTDTSVPIADGDKAILTVSRITAATAVWVRVSNLSGSVVDSDTAFISIVPGYFQDFDDIGGGVPVQWELRTGATATFLGNETFDVENPISWDNTSGGFKNLASATFENEPILSAFFQAAWPDRALGIRQTGAFGDPGAAFIFQMPDTIGKFDFHLSMDLMILSVQPRSTVWSVQVGFGEAPTEFVSLHTYYDPGVFGTTPIHLPLIDQKDPSHRDVPVWFRVVALGASSGSNNRDTFAIDNFSLTWTETEPPTNLNLSGQTVSENEPVGTFVGEFSSSSPVASEGFVYSLVPGDGDGDNTNFSIVGNELRTAAVLDFESQRSHSIRARTTQPDGAWFEKMFEITVGESGASPQTITFPTITDRITTSAPFDLDATASSGLPVSYSIVSPGGIANVSGRMITLTGLEGAVTVKASQPGAGVFGPAPDVYQTFLVGAVSSRIVKLASGQIHAAAIRADGTLWAWGLNSSGQVGDDSTTRRTYPVRIGDVSTWASVACGQHHTVAVRGDGTLWAWGRNSYGGLGDGTTMQRTSPVRVGSETTWASATGGNDHTVAVRSDGTLWAWGRNHRAQLGDGSINNRTSPVQIGSANTWVATACGFDHTMALRSDGTLWAWGDNSSGQLGDGTTEQRYSPKQIAIGNTWTAVACGEAHTIAVRSDGTLWAWGRNTNGQLGDGSTTNRHSPVQVGDSSDWEAVACNRYHTVAVRSDGALWAWGWNTMGQLGDGSQTQRSSPVPVGSSAKWAAVGCGSAHTVAVSSEGTLTTWGNNASGELGDADFTNRPGPVPIDSDSQWIEVTTGLEHNLALRSDGTLWAWGANVWGHLGDGSQTQRRSPVRVGSDSDWSTIASGGNHSLALRGDNTLWVWGNNTYGQLGDGTTIRKTSPLQIGTDTWIAAAGGGNHTVAVRGDGTLWSWGFNANGQLGDGTTTNRSTPVQIGSLKTWAFVACGFDYTVALQTNGTMWAWGSNNGGRLGDGTETQRLAPVQIGSADTWTTVSCGSGHAVARRSDGTYWAWGANSSGQLGDGTTTNSTTPLQIAIGIDLKGVACGGVHTVALHSDGTLWSWGDNTTGQLGDGSFTNRPNPVQIGTSTAWDILPMKSGLVSSGAITRDGTLWTWGSSNQGQLGWVDTATPSHSVWPVRAEQSLTFPPLPTLEVGEQFSLAATATSGLPLTYRVTGPATLVGTTLTAIAPGNVEVIAYQAGDKSWRSTDPVSQTMIIPIPAPEMTVNQGDDLLGNGSGVAFGRIATGGSSTRTFTVTNHGDADLSGLDVSFDGIDAASFSLATVPAVTLAPNEETNFSVTFSPSTTGAKTAILVIASNDPNGDVLVTLTGTSDPPSQVFDDTMGSAGLLGPDSAPDATPFSDSVSNIVKYAFNMNLAGPDSGTMEEGGNGGLPALALENDGEQRVFRYEFVRRVGAGLIYTPLKSPDLSPGSWVPLSASPTVIPIDSEWERVIYEEPIDPDIETTCFGKVQVTLP